MTFREFSQTALAVMGCSVFCSVPVVVASHAAHSPPSFVVRTFVDFYCVCPRPFLGDQFLLLDFVICLVFSLEVTLEGAESACGEACLGTRSCFVAVLPRETVDGVYIPELQMTVALRACECSLVQDNVVLVRSFPVVVEEDFPVDLILSPENSVTFLNCFPDL